MRASRPFSPPIPQAISYSATFHAILGVDQEQNEQQADCPGPADGPTGTIRSDPTRSAAGSPGMESEEYTRAWSAVCPESLLPAMVRPDGAPCPGTPRIIRSENSRHVSRPDGQAAGIGGQVIDSWKTEGRFVPPKRRDRPCTMFAPKWVSEHFHGCTKQRRAGREGSTVAFRNTNLEIRAFHTTSDPMSSISDLTMNRIWPSRFERQRQPLSRLRSNCHRSGVAHSSALAPETESVWNRN